MPLKRSKIFRSCLIWWMDLLVPIWLLKTMALSRFIPLGQKYRDFNFLLFLILKYLNRCLKTLTVMLYPVSQCNFVASSYFRSVVSRNSVPNNFLVGLWGRRPNVLALVSQIPASPNFQRFFDIQFVLKDCTLLLGYS